MSVNRVNQTTSNAIQGTKLQETKLQGSKGAERAGAARETGEQGKIESSTTLPAGAKAEISPRAKEFAKAKSVASSAPDVREDKIAELKRRISSGDYQVNADAVADRMIREHAMF